MALYKDLLGHNLEKFGAVTVFDATFYNPANNKPLITFDTLTVSNISVEAEQKEIRGGQGANLLASYDYGKNATVEITDALASMFSLQYIMGSRLKDTFTSMVRREAIKDGGAWKVPHKPVEDAYEATALVVYDNGEQEQGSVNIANSNNEVTNNGLNGTWGNIAKMFVYYEATFTAGGDGAPSHVKELTLTATDFPPVVRMVGETMFIDVKTGRRVAAQIEIPKFKLNTNFELTFEAEGDASTFDFSGVAIADGKNLIHIRTLGYMDGEDNFLDDDEGIDEGKNPQEGN